MPAREVSGSMRSTAGWTKSITWVGRSRSGTLPDSIRDSSSSSSTINASRSTSFSMLSRKRRAAGGSSSALSRSVSTTALSEASGVRNSWGDVANEILADSLQPPQPRQVLRHNQVAARRTGKEGRDNNPQKVAGVQLDRLDLLFLRFHDSAAKSRLGDGRAPLGQR